jgi:hypothetical protein
MKEVKMPKQTSVEWLFAHLVPHLDWSKVEDRELFRKLKAEAQQMHKEEITDAFNSGMVNSVDWFNDGITEESEQYYNETYERGQDE